MIDRGVAAILIGAGALVACGGQERDQGAAAPSARPDPGRAPGGPVLRWRMTGGFAGLGGPGSLPEFSLYGDGRAIASARTGSAAPLPVLREYRLTAQALRRLLDEARAAGLDRPRTIGSGRVADAMILEISMGAARTRIEQPEGQPGLPAVRFWKRLDPQGWPRADQAAPPRHHRSARVAVLAGESPAAPGQDVSDWPLNRPLGRGEQAAGGLCSVVAGEDRDTAVKHVATAGTDHRWRSGGRVYSVRLRPMLPEERTCRDVART
ncbi:hypothetical protein [Actinomadura rugatobispora]|uniref:Lipoprotein n=1 Tax=Actinomadura rugatobispora TaxID=1994 RepID=A0ABW1ACI7_9ACTN|nr:hypothetical protein GCM10010200_064280 [Actinomadura rugatobispora]